MTSNDESKELEALGALGAEELAKALLDLSVHDDGARDLVESLISTSDENEKRFRAKLSELKRSQRYIPWDESPRFAKKLNQLLLDLQIGIKDFCKGAKLVIEFYETDQANFECCDDSSGYVGDVYRATAVEVFVNYANRCDDKNWIVNLLIDLNRNDEYGVRISLVEHASDFLSEESIRDMAARMQALANHEFEQYRRRHWLHCIETLAMQIRDAEMFEKAHLASHDNVSTAACIAISKAYLAADRAKVALDWLLRISPEESIMVDECELLLFEVHTVLSNLKEQQKIAWRIFRRSRNVASFERLLNVVGEDQRGKILDSEISEILKSERFSYSDAEFLIQLGRMDEAEAFILEHSGQIDGALYYTLLPMAQAMEKSVKWSAATVLYRSMVDSILLRARAKTYSHGVNYLRKLVGLSRYISEWKAIESHVEYLERLRRKHGRKTSFWREFE